MQDKEIKYLPIVVEKVDGEESFISEVDEKGLIPSLWVKSKNLRTLDDLKVEDAERYRLELKRVCMDYSCETLDDIFGTHFMNCIVEFPVSEFFAKVRKYENTPRVGEVWKRIVDGIEVIIRSVDRSMNPIEIVKVYYAKDGASGFLYLSDLEKNYIKTGKSCNSLIPFINELNSLNA